MYTVADLFGIKSRQRLPIDLDLSTDVEGLMYSPKQINKDRLATARVC